MAKTKKRINIMMHPEMLENIDKICNASQMSRSSFIEIACVELIKSALAQPKSKGKA